jgi:hypothetical protein
LGKTYKVIGTLYIINNNPVEAREYLSKAYTIFEGKGMVKLLKEVKNKMKMLNSSVKLAAEYAANEIIESGDESGKEQSPDRGSKGKKKKTIISYKKKGGKTKKTVFRNNFVKDSDSNQQL